MNEVWKEHTEKIKCDKDGYPIYWFDCDFCKGAAQANLKKSINTTLEEMQEFHKNRHRSSIIKIKVE